MTDQAPPTASQRSISASRQTLLDLHVFHMAVHKTRMAMAIADPNLPDCPLVYVNPAFVEITGYAAEDAVGRNCRFLQGAESDQQTITRIREALARGEGFNEDIYNYRKDGSGFWNALHVSPIVDEDGKLIYFFASQVDISAQKEAARRQGQRMESMGALSSGVAHEFNNLMTVVLGSIERAAGRTSDERQAHHLGRAEWAARRAGQLAAELLSLAQRQASEERTIDLNEVVQAFKDEMAQAAGKNIRLRLNLAPEPVQTRLNPGQLELVLLNLVSNASDAMAEGGEIVVTTAVLSAPEAASALNRPSAVALSVSDRGSGMTPEVKRRATELFFTTKQAGTGLGLFLALEFIDHSGGKLTIDSEAGQGTTVRMAFPSAAGR
jgi:PAS domain S-box-containing protein